MSEEIAAQREPSIAFIGVGNLGAALVNAVLKSSLYHPSKVILFSKARSGSVEQLLEQGCTLASLDSTGEIYQEIVVLAVKPQDAEECCNSIRTKLSKDTLLISVMAGVRIERLIMWLGGHSTIGRAMPNLGAHVGKSATAYYFPTNLKQELSVQGEAVLNSFGITVRLAEESLIDACTAVAGSGPAFVYWLIEQMEQFVKHSGILPDDARRLALATVIGASQYMSESNQEAHILRSRVTSKGGTTAAAFTELERLSTALHIQAAFEAAKKRASALS